MKIVFTVNQVSQIQSNATRRSQIYDSVRSYLNIPVGVRFDNFDLIDVLSGNTFIKYQKDSETISDPTVYISIRGVEYDLEVFTHAVKADIAFSNIRIALNHLANGLINVSQLAKVVKHAKLMCDMTEW